MAVLGRRSAMAAATLTLGQWQEHSRRGQRLTEQASALWAAAERAAEALLSAQAGR